MPRCTYAAAWGAFPGLAPGPPKGPLRYRCTLERHTGDHVLDVEGQRREMPRGGRGGVRVGAGRPEATEKLGPGVAVRLTEDDRARLEAIVPERARGEFMRGEIMRGVRREERRRVK